MPFQKENLRLSYHWLKDSFHRSKTQVAPFFPTWENAVLFTLVSAQQTAWYSHNKRFVEKMVYDVLLPETKTYFREVSAFPLWVFSSVNFPGYAFFSLSYIASECSRGWCVRSVCLNGYRFTNAILPLLSFKITKAKQTCWIPSF